jgi:hypothetical protein
MALYFIMADCYVIALAPTPSSNCCSCHHCCHHIVIVSHPATPTEESGLKKEMAGKVNFIYGTRIEKSGPDSRFSPIADLE